ncbi:MAG TPA: hypothetical protein VGQ98_08675 [Gemmatimonadaceae bacterium]|nr:hypothetical protein [Gemmatimonadaceae bacterium]
MTASVADRAAADERVRAGAWTIPWPLYAVVLASTCIVVGLIWDVSWHRTVGRDTFWTLAHVLEQLAAVIAGLSCGWLVLKTTFAGSPEERAQSVRFWRFFQGPLGAWVCIWGTLMIITSAPFDNWWHNAYGLDVKIISPPHMILAWGMMGIQIGAMLMTLSAQNRASDEDQRMYSMMHAYTAGILITMIATVIQEDASVGNQMHGAKFYAITAWTIPLFLVGLSRASRLKWPATTITAIYSAITLVMMWILQLFAATPKLAPIYNPVTHMIPPAFPLLIIVPAFAVDLLMRRLGRGHDWKLSVLIGVTWVAVMLGVHWFWAEFLISPGARNFIFGADQWSYTDRLGPWRYQYWNLDVNAVGKWSPLLFAKGIAFAVLLGIVSSRLSLFWGSGMAKVKR